MDSDHKAGQQFMGGFRRLPDEQRLPGLGEDSGAGENVGMSFSPDCNSAADDTRGDFRHMPATKCLLIAFVLVIASQANAEDCTASFYAVGDASQRGTATASGVPLNNSALTAAHKTLPFRTRVNVLNKGNGRSVVVTITDRGPYVHGRCIDLTKAGARYLGISGLAPVHVEVVR